MMLILGIVAVAVAAFFIGYGFCDYHRGNQMLEVLRDLTPIMDHEVQLHTRLVSMLKREDDQDGW